jgi:hypothetical protein
MIQANNPFHFINERGNTERVKPGDIIFTHVDPNSTKGKTVVNGKILRPVFDQENQQIGTSEVGWVRVNNGQPIDINYCQTNFALACDNALIADLQVIEGNQEIEFVSDLTPII